MHSASVYLVSRGNIDAGPPAMLDIGRLLIWAEALSAWCTVAETEGGPKSALEAVTSRV